MPANLYNCYSHNGAYNYKYIVDCEASLHLNRFDAIDDATLRRVIKSLIFDGYSALTFPQRMIQ